MSIEQLRRYIGRRVVDEGGHQVGRIIGITHHDDGGASALVSCGPWPWSDGLHIDLDGARLVEGDVRVQHASALPPAPTGRAHG